MSSSPILVAGAGAWGTALAVVLARNGNPTWLWGYDATHIDGVRRSRANERYLPGITLPENVSPVSEFALIPREVHSMIVATPFQGIRDLLRSVNKELPAITRVACASKGIERGTQMMFSEILTSTMGDHVVAAMLSGPNFAREVAAGYPAAISIGVHDAGFGHELMGRLHSTVFRPYLVDDLIGVQVGGAVKNVLAIAAGVADGLKLGANSRAALITRGLAEIARLGVALGGRMETFMGLSGLGDLVLTCTDDQSRNRRFGLELGRGATIERAQAAIGSVVEGVPTAFAVVQLAQAMNVDVPIAEQVARILKGESRPKDAVSALLARDPVREKAGS